MTASQVVKGFRINNKMICGYRRDLRENLAERQEIRNKE